MAQIKYKLSPPNDTPLLEKERGQGRGMRVDLMKPSYLAIGKFKQDQTVKFLHLLWPQFVTLYPH